MSVIVSRIVDLNDVGTSCVVQVLELDKEPRLHLHALLSSPLQKSHILRLIVKRGWHIHLVAVEDEAHLQNIVTYMEKDQSYENDIRIIQNETRRHYCFTKA